MRQTYCCRRITSPGCFVSAGRFYGSSGIGILLNRYKQMQRSGGSVAIYGVGVQINRILNLGGIWNLINGFSSKEAAIAGTEG